MSVERWRAVPGYEGYYEVSDHGRVQSIDRITRHGRRRRGRMMRLYPMAANGYLVVNLWRDGVSRTWLVHRLVLLAFEGEPPEGYESLHLNGDKKDNRRANLARGTHSDNQFDQVAHGTHPNASKDQCPSGHDYDEENTYIYPGKPHRGCRKCRRRHMREWHAKKKGVVA